MPIEQKQYSTDPAWTSYLSDTNGWIDVTAAISLKLYGKVQGGAPIGPLAFTATAVNAFTANTTEGSNVLQSVSAFTGIVSGAVPSTITGPGVPAGTKVQSFDSAGGTITMTNAATATATGASCNANVGMATRQPVSTDVATTGVFGCEMSVHWDNTNTLVTIVPNRTNANESLTIDANVTGAAE